MNRLNYSVNHDKRFGSIILRQDSKKNGNSKKSHDQDEAIEEFIDPVSGKEDQKNKKDSEEGDGGMGISEKAKKQNSDESDTINNDK